MITKTDLQNTLSTYNAVVDHELSGLDDRVTTLEKFHVFKYGVRIDQSNSDPDAAVTYLYDAVGKTPAGLDNSNEFDYGDWQDFVYDICKPVMLNPDGTVKYELDRDDQTKKADGTASEYNDATQTANMMVQFKKMYLSVTIDEDDVITAVFSNVDLDETYNVYPFIDENGNEKDYFYVGMLNGTKDSNNKLRSIGANKSMFTCSSSSARTYAQANASGFDLVSFSQFNFLKFLHVLIAKSLDTQDKFGNGPSLSRINYGTTIDKGGFYGSRTATNIAVKTFWIENLWGNGLCSHVGLLSPTSDRKYYIKSTPPYSLTSVEGYTNTDVTKPNNEWYIAKQTVVNGFLLPTVLASGSGSAAAEAASKTYWCDSSIWNYQTGIDTFLSAGTTWGGGCGIFAFSLSATASFTNFDIITRLGYL